MQTVTLTLDNDQARFVAQVIASGRYGDEAEVLELAFRKWQRWEARQQEKLSVLNEAIDEGLASGIVEGSTKEVFARVRAAARQPRQAA